MYQPGRVVDVGSVKYDGSMKGHDDVDANTDAVAATLCVNVCLRGLPSFSSSHRLSNAESRPETHPVLRRNRCPQAHPKRG